MKFFRIKNWDRFQHYDKRNPPWIKVYNELLEDYEFNSMKESTQLNLIKIWLLASRSNNKIPYSEEWIKGRINGKSRVDLEELERFDFIEATESDEDCEQDASTLLDQRQRERQRERKRKRQKYIDQIYKKRFDEIWEQYPQKLGKKGAEVHFKASVKLHYDNDDYLSWSDEEWFNKMRDQVDNDSLASKDWELVQTALRNYIEYKESKPEMDYQHGKTWFNNWKDFIEKPTKNGVDSVYENLGGNNGSNGNGVKKGASKAASIF